MKFNNKILKAVNRGIQLALDDYQDDDLNNSSSNQNDVIDSKDVIKHRMDLMQEVVDLRLPSGTLWCKYNLGINPNQLNTPKDWYGDYYAWGELEGNKTKKNEIYFSWSNYKFGKDYNKLTKYCYDFEYGLNSFTDNLIQLLPEDDVAYQNKKLYNFKFHIPTKEQYEELINYTKNYWVKNYDPNKIKHIPEDDGGINGLNGRVFTSKVNGNTLFIPAAGCYISSSIFNVDSYCYLWSSSLRLDDPSGAYSLNFSSGNIGMYYSFRCYGFSVRPVLNI